MKAVLSLVLVPFATVLYLPFFLWSTFVTWTLYRWYLVPLHAPYLTGWQAAGILLFWGMLRSDYSKVVESQPTDKLFAMRLCVPGVALVIGWFCKTVGGL